MWSRVARHRISVAVALDQRIKEGNATKIGVTGRQMSRRLARATIVGVATEMLAEAGVAKSSPKSCLNLSNFQTISPVFQSLIHESIHLYCHSFNHFHIFVLPHLSSIFPSPFPIFSSLFHSFFPPIDFLPLHYIESFNLSPPTHLCFSVFLSVFLSVCQSVSVCLSVYQSLFLCLSVS